jgi:hypothetical protein
MQGPRSRLHVFDRMGSDILFGRFSDPPSAAAAIAFNCRGLEFRIKGLGFRV